MFFDLMLRVGPAIHAVFELGYEPKEELFHELTAEQYRQLEIEGEDIAKEWYTILPDNHKYDIPELLVVDADGKQALMDAVKYINSICNKAEEHFSSFDDKLKYAATILPSNLVHPSKYLVSRKFSG